MATRECNKKRKGRKRQCTQAGKGLKRGYASRTHGRTQTRAYKSWSHMKDRCLNPNHRFYHRYGGRGIRVCCRWMTFENFYADMGDPPLGKTLHRKELDGGYQPGNCVWLDRVKQNKLRSTSYLITLNGVTKCATDWAKELGLVPATVHYRLRRGWPPELALQGNLRYGKVTKKERKKQNAAMQAVRRAIRSSRLVKPLRCEDCSQKEPLQAHHYLGYAKQHQLDVLWLCTTCHGRRRVS